MTRVPTPIKPGSVSNVLLLLLQLQGCTIAKAHPLLQQFSTGGTRTTGGTPDVAKWYAKK